MKATLKADVLKKAQGSFLGAPVSVTRDEDDDPKRTRRLSPAELNSLIGVGDETRRALRTACLCVGMTIGLFGGALLGRAHEPVPSLPPPVHYRPVVLTLAVPDAPAVAPTAPPERTVARLTRSKARSSLTKPLFASTLTKGSPQ